MFIGGEDKVRENEFVWAPSGEKFTFTNWAPGTPDNFYDEDCTEMVVDDGDGKWNDMPCDERYQGITMCELKLTGNQGKCGILTVRSSKKSEAAFIY